MTYEEDAARIVERVRAKAVGCCGDDKWRGHFCEFHSGYEAALLDVAEELEAMRRGG